MGRKRKTKKKKSGKRGKFIYRSRFPLLFISFVARLKTRAAINRNWRNSLCILLAGFNWWHNFIWNLRIVEKPAGQKYDDVSARSFQQRSMPDNAWYMMHRAGKGVHFSHRRSFPLVRSIPLSLFLVYPRYIVPKPYFLKIIRDTPNTHMYTHGSVLIVRVGRRVLVGCKNPIIIELLVQKRTREKGKKERKKMKGLYASSAILNNLIV